MIARKRYPSDLTDPQWARLAPLLPHDFLPWQTAYYSFRRWQADGTWEAVHDVLHAQVRVAAGRNAQPSAAIIDSQSVKTTEKATVLTVK